MSDLRTAAQQMLEALEGGADSWQLIGPAIDALKEALAEQAEPDSPERRCGGPGCDMTCCQPVQDERTTIADLRCAKWLDPECADKGACQSLKFKRSAEPVQEPDPWGAGYEAGYAAGVAEYDPQPPQQALVEADRIMGHADEATEWRERWAHLFEGLPQRKPVQEPVATMTVREDIIRMARQAGLFHFYDSEGHCDGITDARLVTEDKERDDDRLVEMLAPFAALVAAAERERIIAKNAPVIESINAYIKKMEDNIRAREQA